MLAKQLGEDFFVEKLNPICVNWLTDSIFTIREAAVDNIKEITAVFGHQWLTRYMLPKLMAPHTEGNYLHRLTALFGVAKLGSSLPVDAVRRQFVPVLQTLSKDKVANVRMNVAKSIHALIPVASTQNDLVVSNQTFSY